MQLRVKLTYVSILICTSIWAQDSVKVELDDIEIDILSSYYEQDGKHSPVTGGEGTEELSNIAPSIIINIPMDTVRSIKLTGGVDVYSSASSDNINNPLLKDNHVSSASAQDARKYGAITYKKKNNQKKSSKSYTIGGSGEYDVVSASVGFGYRKASKNNNREFAIKGKYYFDYWKLIYPFELRNGTIHLNTNIRQSLNISLIGSCFLTKRMSFSLNSDFVAQYGLLSTPFHRVYFNDNSAAFVEQLPTLRFKVPVGVRHNWSIGSRLILRNHYRFYWDTWGVQSHTIKSELVIKASSDLRLYPFYRYHIQTAANYFGEYKTIESSESHFTSDFDLSELSTQKYGLGISYAPTFGIKKWKSALRKNKHSMFKEINLRFIHYERSDRFTANAVTIGFKFNIQNGFSKSNWKNIKL
jgi:hypothetical protein